MRRTLAVHGYPIGMDPSATLEELVHAYIGTRPSGSPMLDNQLVVISATQHSQRYPAGFGAISRAIVRRSEVPHGPVNLRCLTFADPDRPRPLGGPRLAFL